MVGDYVGILGVAVLFTLSQIFIIPILFTPLSHLLLESSERSLFVRGRTLGMQTYIYIHVCTVEQRIKEM